MPFTGAGTNIANADDVFFSSSAQGHVIRYNGATAKWNNGPLSVAAGEIVDDAVTEPKLAVSNTPATNQVLSWNGSAMTWVAPATAPVSSVAGRTGAVTLTKTDVGLANVDNTSDVNKPVSTATQTAIDLKVDKTTTVTGAGSITGGGALSQNRTVSLVGDSATPGNGMYYGTNATGSKGYYAIPTGDPTLGGALSGTASAAQIAPNAVGANEIAANAVATSELANDAVTEPKLAIANTPATGQVLSWNGSALSWAGALAFAFTKVNVSSATYTVPSTFTYVFADATAQGITITLPAPANNAYVRVKRMSTNGNGVQVVAPAGSYIDGASVGSDVINNPYQSQEYWSDGTNWYR